MILGPPDREIDMEFLILPDHPASAGITALLPDSPRSQVIPHSSGRPLIVGRWADHEVVTASVGRNSAAVLGTTTLTSAALAERLRTVRSVHDLDTLARSLPGCFHLVASIGGRVRAQGTVSTACQLFHGRVDGVTVAADRPQTIASMTGAGIDEELLALQLLTPFGPPWPLNMTSLWRGVRTLLPGHYVDIRADGTERTIRYWTPPEPELPLEPGVAALREALETAVAARTSRGATISADLSGGKDSTSLCFLAARHDTRLVTVHVQSSDPANEDRIWAARCADRLPHAQHLVVPMNATPGIYAEVASDTAQDSDTPLSFARRPMMEHVARLVADHGSAVHLQGTGSDELFIPSALSLQALAHSHPLSAVRPVRAMKSMRRWTWATTLHVLLYNQSYPRWMASAAEGITAERAWGTAVDWEIAPKMPPWATADAIDAVRRRIHHAASQNPEPLAPLPVHHEMLRLTQVNGTAVRTSSRIGAGFGVSFQAPFIDDRVLEAAMSIRPADRMAPGQVKPVLAAAMRGIAPDDLLARQSKADASPELYIGLRRHRRRLTELFEDSRLAHLGLVDVDGIRTVLNSLHIDTRPLMPFELTLANELWLRALPTHARPAGTPTPQPVRGAS
ncbi:hypothetical protein SSPO_020890 [Streptomyces antimycoticus]|uniref:asparagine synthase (glutamine-hydrolyzing) n=1 Tax=Streptomyces antimycoticus TaxID=68175 RepID=A0A499UQ95_9ACTN|nr:hypothetical protein SSPO_020890 [Streptomyces antimycoticus]